MALPYRGAPTVTKPEGYGSESYANSSTGETTQWYGPSVHPNMNFGAVTSPLPVPGYGYVAPMSTPPIAFNTSIGSDNHDASSIMLNTNGMTPDSNYGKRSGPMVFWWLASIMSMRDITMLILGALAGEIPPTNVENVAIKPGSCVVYFPDQGEWNDGHCWNDLGGVPGGLLSGVPKLISDMGSKVYYEKSSSLPIFGSLPIFAKQVFLRTVDDREVRLNYYNFLSPTFDPKFKSITQKYSKQAAHTG